MNRKRQNAMKDFIDELEGKALDFAITDKPLSQEAKAKLESRIENIEMQLIESLLETSSMVWDLDKSLELLEHDIEATQDGWGFNFVIDYTDLHRYLHPLLDVDRHKPEKFYIAQLVLQYLFRFSKERLLLLPVYIEEFKHRLQRTRTNLHLLLSKESTTLRQRETAELFEKRFRLVDKYALDLLVASNVETSLIKSIERFEDLVERGKICFLEQLKNVELSFAVDTLTEEFKEIYTAMAILRPDYFYSNVTDATAALWIKKANELNFDRKQAFVLISSAPRIRPAFQKVKFNLTGSGKEFRSPILRDLYYILFQYYFCREKLPSQKVMKDIKRTRNLFREYTKRMAEIQAKSIEISLADLDKASVFPLYRQVLTCLWRFEEFMVKKIDFKPIKPISDAETLMMVGELAKNEEAFRQSVKYALDALNSSILAIDKIYGQIKARSKVQ